LAINPIAGLVGQGIGPKSTNESLWVVGCQTLHDMHKISLSKKYVIPIYKNLFSPVLRVFLHHLLFTPHVPKIRRIFKINKGKIW
jgi:hypothetical protein